MNDFASHWSLDDIQWSSLDPALVSADLLAAVKTAALVEANSADYVVYLHNVFRDDDDFKAAASHWGIEEVQHGAALGRWAELVDPEFDFAASLARFRAGYSLPLDAAVSVRGSPTGELLARCVVESGTCSYYSAIRDFTREPVLRQICQRIAQDESRHYLLFKRFYERYPRLSLFARLRIALGRVAETGDDELGYAWFSANYSESDGKPTYDRTECTGAYQDIATGMYARQHVHTLVHMIMQAVGLRVGRRLQQSLVGLVVWVLKRRSGRHASDEEALVAS